MDQILASIKKGVYDRLDMEISDLEIEEESKEYAACRFHLRGRKVICRNAKTTPKKAGQFVTCWKRERDGPIQPFGETDLLDFLIVNVKTDAALGQFVFPKSVLIKQGILSTSKNEGKRAFRVYPGWDVTTSKQAQRAQKWQLEYFYELDDSTNLKRVAELFNRT